MALLVAGDGGGVTGRDYILTLSCPDRRGIVAAVSAYLSGTGCNIVDAAQFGDTDSGLFFMRVHVVAETDVVAETKGVAETDVVAETKGVTETKGAGDSGAVTFDALRAGFTPIADRFQMSWRLYDSAVRPRLLILVSRYGHCLNDLLFRHGSGALDVDVPAVVSNHPDFADLATSYGVPFHHLPVTPRTRPSQEAAIMEIVERERVDLVVLARYMQVLSPELCARLDGRAVNIHHSFLPSFSGARPYHQAHARGVKVIGATAHYVTATLDDGPIIEQDVIRVDHSASPARLAAIGRDVECRTLARAVAWHVEHRVLINGNRTVVFS